MKLLMENWNKFVSEELSVADEFGVSDEEAAEVAAQDAELFYGPRGEVWIRYYPDEEEEPYRKQSHDGMEPDYERDMELEEKKDDNWIQKAVNPEHEGYCTPMTKKTCTPPRKALAKRFKKAARKEKKEGGTGWQGKV
tara:strand:- start:281 stop:694 length:414 start_codon:yes stop_codon:yes gene_type:complete